MNPASPLAVPKSLKRDCSFFPTSDVSFAPASTPPVTTERPFKKKGVEVVESEAKVVDVEKRLEEGEEVGGDEVEEGEAEEDSTAVSRGTIYPKETEDENCWKGTTTRRPVRPVAGATFEEERDSNGEYLRKKEEAENRMRFISKDGRWKRIFGDIIEEVDRRFPERDGVQADGKRKTAIPVHFPPLNDQSIEAFFHRYQFIGDGFSSSFYQLSGSRLSTRKRTFETKRLKGITYQGCLTYSIILPPSIFSLLNSTFDKYLFNYSNNAYLSHVLPDEVVPPFATDGNAWMTEFEKRMKAYLERIEVSEDGMVEAEVAADIQREALFEDSVGRLKELLGGRVDEEVWTGLGVQARNGLTVVESSSPNMEDSKKREALGDELADLLAAYAKTCET